MIPNTAQFTNCVQVYLGSAITGIVLNAANLMTNIQPSNYVINGINSIENNLMGIDAKLGTAITQINTLNGDEVTVSDPTLGTTNTTVLNTALADIANIVKDIAHGGTGATTRQAAINNLTGTQTDGYILMSNGTNATLTSPQNVLNKLVVNTSSGVTNIIDGDILMGNSNGDMEFVVKTTAMDKLAGSVNQGYVLMGNGVHVGMVSPATAINNLVRDTTNGKYLRADGNNAVMSTIQASDVPTLNQDTTGTSANVTGTVAILHGGTGKTTQQDAINSLTNVAPTDALGSYLRTDGTNGVVMSRIQSQDLPTNITSSTSGNSANVTGVVAIANGGTGKTDRQSAINELVNNDVTVKKYLRADGTNVVMSTIQASDVPTLNQDTTGLAGNVTGVVAIANGGTGQTTWSAAIKALVNNDVTSGKYLRADGTNVIMDTIKSSDLPSAITATITGTATNVSGVVAIANGGTGQTQRQDAINTLTDVLPATTAGQYLRTDGTNGVTISNIQSSDLPTNITSSTSGNSANVTGVVAIANGGTGATGKQAALNNLAPSLTDGLFLRSDGTNVVSTTIQSGDVPGTVVTASDPTTNTQNSLDTALLNLNNRITNISNSTIWYPCQVRATGNVNINNPGTNTFDGVVLSNGDYIFLYDQTNPNEYNIYKFNGSNSAMTPVLTTWSQAMSANIVIVQGTTYNDKRYYNINGATGVIGTNPLSFSPWNTAYVPGTGIQMTNGNTINVSTVPIANGGTGATDQQSAINALVGSQSGKTGYVLASDGTNMILKDPNVSLTSSASQNVALGYQALLNSNSNNSNTAVGYQSQKTTVGGNYNASLGYQSLQFSTGDQNSAVGAFSMSNNVSGHENVAVGTQALYNQTSGYLNAVIGSNSGYVLTTGHNNLYFGPNLQASDSAVTYEYVIGSSYDYGSKLTGKGANTCYIGARTGAGDIDVKLYVGTNSTDIQTQLNRIQTVLGSGTITTQTALNTLSGTQTAGMIMGSDGTNTKLYTPNSLLTNYNASDINTAIGYQSLFSISTGTYNTTLGYTSGKALTTGSKNTFIGSLSANLAAGNGNIALGSNNILYNISQDQEYVIGSSLKLGSPFTGKGPSTCYIGGLDGTGTSINIKLYVGTNPTDIQTQITTIQKSFSGILNHSDYDCTVSGSTATVSWAANTQYYVNGVLYTLTVGSQALTLSTGMNYIFYNSSGALVLQNSVAWDLYTQCPLFAVYYNGTQSIVFDELHPGGPNSMDNATHYNLHTTRGTQLVSGCVLTLSAALQQDNISWSMTAGQIADEDLYINTLATTTSSYKILYYNGTIWTYVISGQSVIVNTGQTQYTPSSSGYTLTNIPTSGTPYVNYWVVASDVFNKGASTNPGIFVIAGQTSYSSLANAQAATVSSELGTTISGLFTESVFLYRITYRYTGGAPQGSQIYGLTKLNQSLITVVNSLAGTISIVNGGTSSTTQQGAINNLTNAYPSLTAGQYLRSDGTNGMVLSGIQASDVPTLNQNTTGTSANVTGVVAIANGGTGQTNAANALTALTGTQHDRYALMSDGTNTTLTAPQTFLNKLVGTQTAGYMLMSDGTNISLTPPQNFLNNVTGTQTAGYILGSNGSNTALYSQKDLFTIFATTNSVLGYQSLSSLTSGTGNSVFGCQAAQNLTDGILNSSIGYGSGQLLGSGQYNVYLGAYTSASNSTSDVKNEIVIGAGYNSKSLRGLGAGTCYIGGINSADGTDVDMKLVVGKNKTDVQTQLNLKPQSNGVLNASNYSISVGGTNNTIATVNWTAGTQYVAGGVLYTLSTASSFVSSTMSVGNNYIYYNSSGTLIMSTTIWNLMTDCPLFVVCYNTDDIHTYYILDYRYPGGSNGMTNTSRDNLYRSTGTKLLSGCVLSLSKPLNDTSDTSYLISSGQIAIQDLYYSSQQKIQTQCVFLQYINSLQLWKEHDLGGSAQDLYVISGKSCYQDQSNSYSQTQLSSGYMNQWTVIINEEGYSFGKTIQGQRKYNTLSDAQNASAVSELGQTLNYLPHETIFLYKITYGYTALNTYGGVQIVSTQQLNYNLVDILPQLNNVGTGIQTNYLQNQISTIQTQVPAINGQTTAIQTVPAYWYGTGQDIGTSAQLTHNTIVGNYNYVQMGQGGTVCQLLLQPGCYKVSYNLCANLLTANWMNVVLTKSNSAITSGANSQYTPYFESMSVGPAAGTSYRSACKFSGDAYVQVTNPSGEYITVVYWGGFQGGSVLPITDTSLIPSVSIFALNYMQLK